MHEGSTPNESALELRLKQTNKYVTIGLVAVLAICVLMFAYINSVRQSEQDAQKTKQAIVEITNDSSYCAAYPSTPLCVQAREVAANPNKVLTPKDGEKGDTGPAGRGVADFNIVDGSLVVNYTDGERKNVGKVVGKDGAIGPIGPIGPAGRGILSSNLVDGALVVHYTDSTSENLGLIMGPAGKDGLNGKDGAKGADGISILDVKLDSTNTVQVYYSDGTVRPAGQLIINTIKFMECNQTTNVLTIGMTDGTSFSATVDCNPNDDTPPAAQPAPTPSPTPTTATTASKK